MNLNGLCVGVYPSCPQLTSQGKFVTALFKAAGATPYISPSLLKQLFSGDKPFSENQKVSFRGTDNFASLTDFFVKNIPDEKVMAVIASFGIPEKAAPNKKALASALAMQMRAIVESDANEVDDIIAMEYQRLKTEPSAEQAELSKSLYPGDSAWVLECKPQRSYSTNCYDRFSHEWLIQNTGTQAWHRRKLVLTSRFKNGPAVSPYNIEIPDTEAGKDIKIAIDINAGGGEGRFELIWMMQDSDGNDCFPNNRHLFCVSINTKFEAK